MAESAGDEQRIEKIGKVLERREGVRLEEVGGYLKLLPPNSLQPLMKVLGELSNPKARRTICDAVCQIGKDQVEQVLPFMEDRRWYLVRNVVYILGRIGKEAAIPSIKALVHREMRVRREAVHSLGFIGGSKAFNLLVKALQDSDMRVRCAAALNLGKVGRKNSLIHLSELIQGKEFPRKEPAEERQVTADGVTQILPKPFMVLATQNPIEYEGTFPLPEAQLDRFLLRVRLGYPA